jgi:hypothetical protein
MSTISRPSDSLLPLRTNFLEGLLKAYRVVTFSILTTCYRWLVELIVQIAPNYSPFRKKLTEGRTLLNASLLFQSSPWDFRIHEDYLDVEVVVP